MAAAAAGAQFLVALVTDRVLGAGRLRPGYGLERRPSRARRADAGELPHPRGGRRPSRVHSS